MKNLVNVIVISGIVIVVAVAGGIYAFAQKKEVPATAENIDQTVISQPTLRNQYLPASPDISALQAGGSSYLDPQEVYNLLYPSDFELSTQNDGQYTRLLKKGATQKGQTELYDGVLLVLNVVNLQGKSLDQYVDTHIQEQIANGMAQLVKPKTPTMLGMYPGFTFRISSLGDHDTLVVQKDGNSDYAVEVTFLVADPQQKGYQQQVDQILATLKIQK